MILSQPKNSTNEVGYPISLSVLAVGTPELQYQWMRFGTNLPGETNAVFSIAEGALADAGTYSVQVTNSLGSVVSSNAEVAVVLLPPYIVRDPRNVSVAVGQATSFSVDAGGAKPLSFQWFFNQTNVLAGATNATLALSNVVAVMEGQYHVVVANQLGAATSAVAGLEVFYPPATFSLVSTSVVSGNILTVPVRLRGNGIENSVSFSLSYDKARLVYLGAEAGPDATDGALLVNNSATNSGQLGVVLALQPGETLAAGTNIVAHVQFYVPVITGSSPVSSQIRFGSQPVERKVVDAFAVTRESAYGGLVSVVIQPTPLEGDVSSRPNGDRSLTINDWVQVGRFVAGLDAIGSASEFQRADTAPRLARGDGQLKVTDWVQAGRYAIGLDPLTAAGGPTSIVTQTSGAAPGRSQVAQTSTRSLKVLGASAIQGLNVTVPVVIEAQGNESAVGFSLSFDPAAFSYVSVQKGSGFANGSINVNASKAAQGLVGVVLGQTVSTAGTVLPAGQVQIAIVTLKAKTADGTGSYSISFGSNPVALGVSDVLANELTAVPTAGAIVVNPKPTLSAVRSAQGVMLTWPTWAEGFTLQGGGIGGEGWTNLVTPLGTNGASVEAVVPVGDEPVFFRLRHP